MHLKAIEKNYTVASQTTNVLKKISLRIETGECVAIVGASGSGKSSLMNIMGLLDRPTHGQYFLNDREVSQLNDDELAKVRNQMIGFVFQSFFLLPRMTAIQNVGLPLKYRDELSPEEVMQRSMLMLDKVGLKDFYHRKPNELSGGQQQRVAIARALVTRPMVLLADEPTGALDSKTGQEVMDLFLRLNQEDKTTLVIITHEHKIAQQCRRMIRIEDGRATECETLPAEVIL